MITCDEDGLVVDLPRNWRIGFDWTISRYEWGIGASIYYAKSPKQVGIYVMLLPFYLTIDIWSRAVIDAG